MNVVVAAGFVVAAAVGALVRYRLRMWASDAFRIPVGTLAVNLVGCLLLGAVAGWEGPWATVLVTGGLGALTTFSTFSAEVVDLWRDDGPAFLVYIGLSLVGGLALAYVGLQIG